MNITNIRNPKYADPTGTFIDFEVQFEQFGEEWLPFTYGPNQPEPHFAQIENEWLSVPANVESIAAYVEPPPVIPSSVTRRQAKQALVLAGLLGNVQPAIDAITDPTERSLIQIEWDDSQVFQRDRPALIALGTALGLDSAGIDALFTTAAGIP